MPVDRLYLDNTEALRDANVSQLNAKASELFLFFSSEFPDSTKPWADETSRHSLDQLIS